MIHPRSVEVIGIRLYSGTLLSAVDHVLDEVVKGAEPKNLCISATGAHGIIEAKKNPSFKDQLNHFYMNLPDGMPGVWVGRLKGASEMERGYGPDFFKYVMERSAGRPVNHFFCGGKEGVAGKLRDVCREKFGNTNVTGIYTPPFKKVDEFDYSGIAEKINQSGADIVWIGISTPKQEEFAARLSRYTRVHFLITVGAAFDFHIGNVKQAPAWIQKAGLEWFFRLCMEPGRLYKRYLDIVPRFLWFSCLDLWKNKVKSRRSD
jgi:N-acetylglucosaminyldiphosphoundecaprenol N-acetyl-beta-D-mannosaminyltransferase